MAPLRAGEGLGAVLEGECGGSVLGYSSRAGALALACPMGSSSCCSLGGKQGGRHAFRVVGLQALRRRRRRARRLSGILAHWSAYPTMLRVPCLQGAQ